MNDEQHCLKCVQQTPPAISINVTLALLRDILLSDQTLAMRTTLKTFKIDHMICV